MENGKEQTDVQRIARDLMPTLLQKAAKHGALQHADVGYYSTLIIEFARHEKLWDGIQQVIQLVYKEGENRSVRVNANVVYAFCNAYPSWTHTLTAPLIDLPVDALQDGKSKVGTSVLVGMALGMLSKGLEMLQHGRDNKLVKQIVIQPLLCICTTQRLKKNAMEFTQDFDALGQEIKRFIRFNNPDERGEDFVRTFLDASVGKNLNPLGVKIVDEMMWAVFGTFTSDERMLIIKKSLLKRPYPSVAITADKASRECSVG
ncbi:hypothetical protein ACFL2D_00445 [Patescibacteria group bacterium]